jgi:hypothetical protein
MALRVWIAGLMIAAASAGSAAGQPNRVSAVAPGAPGVLTKCRDWIVTSSCRTYQHIALPPKIAVGDTITVTFGSSPKEYRFPVARITLEGRHCAIFSEPHGKGLGVDTINVAPCHRSDAAD